jgi:hypothetical protein
MAHANTMTKQNVIQKDSLEQQQRNMNRFNKKNIKLDNLGVLLSKGNQVKEPLGNYENGKSWEGVNNFK